MALSTYRTLYVARVGVCLSLFLSFCLSSWANPEGGAVVAGGATISSAGATTTIQQSTDRAVIHWQGFSIAPGETTSFVQPAASSVVLNRVTSGNASQLMGTLQANGQVYLLNPNGIFIGNGAVIDVGSFLATTHHTDEDAFMRGGELTFTGPSTAGIRNEGKVRANGGDVYLLARKVENEGEIVAEDGTVGLMAGTKFYLQGGGGVAPAVRVELEEDVGEGQGTGVKNTGLIRAAQARLEAAGNLYSLAVSQRGLVQATGTKERADGKIILSAPGGKLEQAGTLVVEEVGRYGSEVAIRAMDVTLDPSSVITAAGREGGGVKVEAEGTVWVQGKMDVTGSEGKGGKITVTGARVGLREAQLDASGAAGGGEILLGGDFQGKNPAVRNAERAFVSADSVIRADAVVEGDGGKVITWSDEGTLFYGEVSARGGAEGGDGGLVEVSGRDYLDFQGLVDTRAPMGQAGMLWLDPLDLLISNAGPTGMNSTASPFAPVTEEAKLDWGTIQAQLAGGNVMVTTVGTPTVDDSDGTITMQNSTTLTSPFNLTLQAAGEIVVGNPAQSVPAPVPVETPDQIIFQGGGSLILQAAKSITFNADLQINGGGNLTALSTGGDILDQTPPQLLPPINFLPGIVKVTGNTVLSGETITLNSTTHSFSGSIEATGGTLSLINAGAVEFGNVQLSTALTVEAGGNITQVNGSAVVAPSAFLTGDNINLGSLANDFGSLGFSQANGNVTLADQNNLEFSTTTITGTLDLSVGGNLTQTGVMNVQGNVTFNAGGDIYLPLAGIPGNELAWGGVVGVDAKTVTVERARDVFLGVQNEIRLDVATTDNFNPSIRNLTLRLREVTFTDVFAITGIASFEGTTDFAQIFVGDFAAPPPSLTVTDLQVTQADLDQITSASEIRFGAHTYTPGTGAITAITQKGNIQVANGTSIPFSTQLLAGSGALNTLGTLSVQTASALTAANFTVVADDMNFAGTVTVDQGVVTLRPLSPGLTIGFNVDPAKTPVDLNLSTAAASITGASSLVLGSLTQSGAFIVGGNGVTTRFEVPVIFQTGSGIGEVQLYGELTTVPDLLSSPGSYDLTIRGNLSPRSDGVSVNSSSSLSITGRIGGTGGSLFGVDLEADGAVTVGGTISQLTNFSVTGQSVTLSGAISEISTSLQATSTAGGITFGSAVSDVPALTATAINGTAVFSGILSGGTTTVSANAKNIRIGAVVNGIESLDLTASEAIGLDGGSIVTTGDQTYTGSVVLGVTTTAATRNADNSGIVGTGDIRFNGVLDSADPDSINSVSLTVNTKGVTLFGGAVGSNARLLNLTTDNSGAVNERTQINGTSMAVWLNQTFADEVILGSDATSFLFGTGSGESETNFLTFESEVSKGSGKNTVVLLSEGERVVFSGAVDLGGLSIGAVDSVEIRAGGTIGSAVSFGTSTTRVLIGNDATDTTIFSGGLTVAAGGNDIGLAGTIGTGNGNLSVSSFQLLADTVLATGTGNITMGGFVNGGSSEDGFDLTLQNTGTVTFGGLVGYYLTTEPVLTVEAPLNSLNIPTASGIFINGGQVLTTLGQAYVGPVTLGANTSLNSNDGGLINFQNSVTGSAFTLTLQNTTVTPGNVNFGGSIQLGGLVTGAGNYGVSLPDGGTIDGVTTFGNTGGLTLGGVGTTTTFSGGVTATAPGSITLAGGTIQTVNSLMNLGDGGTGVTLTGDTTLSTGSGSLTLGGAVNGVGRNLTLNSTGTTTLAGAVGPLGSLTTDTGGAIVISGGSVTSSGSQTYQGPLSLIGASTLTSTGAGITFAGTVESNGSLNISTAAGAALNGGRVTTTGAQLYTGAVLLGANSTLTGTTVTLGTVNNPFALTVAGNAVFTGVVGGIAPLTSVSVSGATSTGALAMTTTGSQSYGGTVTLNGATSFVTTGSGSVSFGSTLVGGFAATVISAGGATFTGLISDPLSITAGGDVQIGPVATAGGVTIQSGGRVALTGSSYEAAAITITAASLANQTGVASPFINPGVLILTARPNGNSPSSLNGGFADFGYAFLPAPQVNSPGILGTMVYRFFDAPGVATPLQYTETAQTFAYTAAVPVSTYAGPRPFAGEVRLGRIEGAAPTGQPGGAVEPMEDGEIPPPPTQLSRTKPKYGSPFAKVLITEREKAKAAEAQEKSIKSGVGRLKVSDTVQIPPVEIRQVGGERLTQLQNR